MDHERRFKNQLARLEQVIAHMDKDDPIMDFDVYHELNKEILTSWAVIRMDRENDLRTEYGPEYTEFFDALNEELDTPIRESN